MKPSIGQIVHYVSYGTPGGEFTSECRAAVITEYQPEFKGTRAVIDVERVGLAVINPTGLFFRTLADGGCRYNGGQMADPPKSTNLCGGAQYPGGTWHWPEKIQQKENQQ